MSKEKLIAICPECGEEKEIGPRTGICKSCAHKKASAKYLAKKKSVTTTKEKDNLDSILRKELEEIDESKEIEKQKEKNLYSEEIIKLVKDDIEYNLKMKNISLPKGIDFKVPFQVLKTVLDNVNLINEYLNAEDIFNKLENDYRHGYEHAKTSEQFDYWSRVYKCFLDERRSIKNIISEFETGGYFFDKLAKDKDFMEQFNEAYNGFIAIRDMNERGTYRQVSDSKLVKNTDFCIGKKTETTHEGKYKYYVSIRPMNKNQAVFTRYAIAKSEQEAISEVLNFIKSINYQIRFRNPEDITVKRVSFGSEKECL